MPPCWSAGVLMVTTPQGKRMELRQACDFGVYYVIYVNILKMEVIYVIFLLFR